jgi:hypothetical protein
LPIPNIFCLSPASEMIGVDAGRIVARVPHDFGEFTVLDKVGDSGSLLLASVQPEMPVTVWVGVCRPFMTAPARLTFSLNRFISLCESGCTADWSLRAVAPLLRSTESGASCEALNQ